jgi:hypothetical protein
MHFSIFMASLGNHVHSGDVFMWCSAFIFMFVVNFISIVPINGYVEDVIFFWQFWACLTQT